MENCSGKKLQKCYNINFKIKYVLACMKHSQKIPNCSSAPISVCRILKQYMRYLTVACIQDLTQISGATLLLLMILLLNYYFTLMT